MAIVTAIRPLPRASQAWSHLRFEHGEQSEPDDGCGESVDVEGDGVHRRAGDRASWLDTPRPKHPDPHHEIARWRCDHSQQVCRQVVDHRAIEAEPLDEQRQRQAR